MLKYYFYKCSTSPALSLTHTRAKNTLVLRHEVTVGGGDGKEEAEGGGGGEEEEAGKSICIFLY